MTTEELLKPRYKVIADYPGSQYSAGDILTVIGTELYTKGSIEFFEQYPHLFKSLQWWEDRKPEDMPEYVKIVERPWFVDKKLNIGDIAKIHKHFTNSLGDCNPYGCQVFGNDFMSYYKCVPATETEYNEYIKTVSK